MLPTTRITNASLLAFIATTLFGFINAQGVGSKDLFRCRQSCYQKFVQDWHHCMDFEDCKNMCITPPNINSYIPEAFSFLCWSNCDSQLGPFALNINSALRQGSLVLTDIAWDQAITNASKQCLVTWEVSGGGLMGNLLTDSSTVELSLWLDTVYHVQVTCKHKETGGMRRSFKLIVDTHKLSDSTASGMQSMAIDTGIKNLPTIFSTEQASSSETDSRMRILKDSSKDFLSPYTPNGVNAAKSQTPVKVSSSSSASTSESSTVIRTKLTAEVPEVYTVDFLTQIAVFAAVGSLILFFGLLIISALIRPARKAVKSAGLSSIDKEVLIHREMLPSQTPAAAEAISAPEGLTMVTTTPGGTSSAGTSPAGTTESRTLHV